MSVGEAGAHPHVAPGAGREPIDAPPLVQPAVTAKRRRPRWLRILLWTLAIVLLLVVLTIGFLFWALANLDHPWFSGWIKSTIGDATGMSVDYTELSIAPFSGVEAADLVVHTPDPYAQHAPDLVRLDGLDVEWDLLDLISGTPEIERVALRGLTLTIVIDETGRTSLDALGASDVDAEEPEPPEPEPEPEPPSEPSRLSNILADVLPDLEIDAMHIDTITVQLVWTRAGMVERRATFTHVCVDSVLDTEVGALAAEFALRGCPNTDGVELTVEDHPDTPHERTRALVAQLELQARTLAPTTIELSVRSDLVRQDLLAAGTLPDQLIRGRIEVALQPQDGKIRVHVDQLSALSGGVTTDLVAEILDQPDGAITPRVERGTGGVDIAPMRPFVHHVLATMYEQFELPSGQLRYQVTALALDPDTGVVRSGDIEIDGTLPRVHLVEADLKGEPGQAMTIDDATIQLKAALRDAGDSTLEGTVQLAGFVMDAGVDDRTALTGVSSTVRGSGLTLDVDDPIASRGVFDITGRADSVESDLDGQATRVRGADFTGTFNSAEFVSGSGRMPVQFVSFDEPSADLSAHVDQMEIDWTLEKLDLDGRAPTDLKATVKLAAADYDDGYQRTSVTDTSAVIETRIRDPYHFDASVDMPIAKLNTRTTDGIVVRAGGASVAMTVTDFSLDDVSPARSTGQVSMNSKLARVRVTMDGLSSSGRHLGLTMDTTLDGSDALTMRGRMPIGQLEARDTDADERLIRVERSRLNYQLNDLILDLEDPMLSRGRIRLTGKLPSVLLPAGKDDDDVSVDIGSLVAKLTMRGTARAYDADVDVKLASYTASGQQRDTDVTAVLRTRADLRSPMLDSTLTIRGPRGPDITANIDTRFRRKNRDLTYDVAIAADRLALIGELLPTSIKEEHAIDWQGLTIDGTSNGQLQQVIERFIDGVEPVFVDNPIARARGHQKLALTITGLDYRGPDQSLQSPKLQVAFDASEQAGPLSARIDIDSERLVVALDGDSYTFTGLDQHFGLSSSGTPERGRINLNGTLAVTEVKQDLIVYPIEDAKFFISGYLDRLSALRIEQVNLTNPAGGTRVEAALAMDRLLQGSFGNASAIPGRQAMTLTGTWRQTLDPVRLAEDAPTMRGKVTLPFRVESGDLSAFLIAAQAKLSDVDIELPEDDIKVVGFSGDIPLLADIAILPDGSVQLIDGPAENLYSRTRFLDVHPFLHDDHYLSIERVDYADERFGPIAGNLRIERDTLALDQLELGYRQGSITGQLLIDYKGGKPRMSFRGNMTGIRPSKGKDVLDANGAISFVPAKLALEGRMQIIRLGRKHLLEILDMLDPYREDVDFNRIRLALKVGYPKYMRLRMKDGFMSANIKLGGVSKIVRIGEIRGIALEPLLNYYVVPYLPEGMLE